MITTSRHLFGANTTTDEVLNGINLEGKLALITGASSGLGVETARAFASKGASIILAVRDVDKALKISQSIANETANPDIFVENLNLASFKNVRDCAQRVASKHDHLDLLINNAGLMACPYDKTEDGFEMQFGTNHLGHFLLTCLLTPLLLEGDGPRVISLSSRGHRMSPVLFEDINFEQTPYNKWVSYGQSKTANILFTIELERQLGPQGVHAFAVHPGAIQTELSRHMEQSDHQMLSARAPGGQMHYKTVAAGAATTVYAATAPELKGRGGLYLEDCSVSDIDDTDTGIRGVRSYAVDPQNAKKLWALSEEWIGSQFLEKLR